MSQQNPITDVLSSDLREAILQDLPCGLCVALQDETDTILYANESFYRMYGFDSAQAASEAGMKGVFDRAVPESRALLKKRTEALFSGAVVSASLETRQRKSDGSVFWVMVRIRRAKSEGGALICACMDITAQKQVEEELRFREEEYRIAVCQSDKFVLRYDITNKTAYLPPESAKVFQRDVLYDMPAYAERAGVIGPDSLCAFRALFQKIQVGAPSSASAALQLKFSCNAGVFEWYRVAYSLIYRDDSTPAQAVISLENISEQHEREVAYKRWEQTYAAMSPEKTAYIEFDLTQNRLERQKGGLIESFSSDTEQAMESVVTCLVERWAHPDDRVLLRESISRERLLAAYFRGAKPEKLEYRQLREGGGYYWVRLSVQMLPDPYTSNVRASFLLRDIDEKKREELKLQDRLRTDPLTGVLNRNAITVLSESVFAGAKCGGLQAFVMVDVDHFKRVNDGFGHGIGDRVLIRVAETLRSALRSDDLVGRLGGDEFMLLLKNIAHEKALLGKLESLREQLVQRLDDDRTVTCSFGAAICPRDGTEFDELYRKADIALYQAKNDGRNCARIYEDDMYPAITLFDEAR